MNDDPKDSCANCHNKPGRHQVYVLYELELWCSECHLEAFGDNGTLENDEIPVDEWSRDRLLYTLGLWDVPVPFTASLDALRAAVREYEAQRLATATRDAPPDMETQQMLVLSTAHLHPDDALKLTELDADLYVLAAFNSIAYGWLTWRGHWSDDEKRTDRCDEWKTDLFRLAEEARARGCDFLRFDQDGPTYDHLPSYEW